MQRSAVAAGLDLRVGLLGLLQRQIVREGNYAFQCWIESLQPVEMKLG